MCNMKTGRTPGRMRFTDTIWNGALGLIARPTRTILTAAGIGIGIASIVAIVAISASSRTNLLAELDRFGTNLLRVSAGQSLLGQETTLKQDSAAMVRRIDPVESAASVAQLPTTVRRTDLISLAETGGISVFAAEPSLRATLNADMRAGRFLDEVPSDLPSVVLGAKAAERLGIRDLAAIPSVFLGDEWFAVVGILERLPLVPEIDRSVLITYNVASGLLGLNPTPTMLYVRTHPDRVTAVRAVLPRTANPSAPNEITVSRPSDVLEARAATDATLTALLLGLGAVSLLVGGIGIANVMVIAVLERRTEIGIRRAIGATRANIRRQFLTESVILASIGGLLGVVLGTAIAIGYATRRNWLIDIPIQALAASVAVSLLIGATAGLYPASRAARLQPAEAVRPPT